MSFMEIFQPGLKHLREERERQRMDVAHPTKGADPLMEIDLDAGTATIVVPNREEDSAPTAIVVPDSYQDPVPAEADAGPDHSRTSSDPA